MAPTRITYSVRPSFQEESFCEFNRSRTDDSYNVHVQSPYSQQRIVVSAEKMSSLLGALRDLRLAVPTENVEGLDGTIYSLTVGTTTSVTYAWWESIPDEWSELRVIVTEILNLTGMK